MGQRESTPAVGENLGHSAKAVWLIGKRNEQERQERTFIDAERPGNALALDQRQSKQIITVLARRLNGGHAGRGDCSPKR